MKLQEMREKRKSAKYGIMVKVLLLMFMGYAVVTITSQRLQIQRKTNENKVLESKIVEQELVNEEYKEMIENANDENYAKIARENLGYISRGERVFVDISGM